MNLVSYQNDTDISFKKSLCGRGERGGSSVVKRQLRSERLGVRNLSPPYCVIEQDTLLPKGLVIPRKRWLRPDMTEKLLTGTLNLNTNKLCGRKHIKW